MSIVLVGSSSGSITLQEPAVAGTTTLNLPATSGTVVVTGTTPTLNGITFPATQSPSADANTLDDYEEGTWTPTVTGSGGASGVTYGNQQATYTKIGRIVYAQVFVDITSKGTGTGSVRVGGLPFTSNATYQSYQNEVLGVSMVSDANNIFVRINPSTTTLSFEFYDTRASSTAASRGEIGYASIGNNFRLIAGLVYQTS